MNEGEAGWAALPYLAAQIDGQHTRLCVAASASAAPATLSPSPSSAAAHPVPLFGGGGAEGSGTYKPLTEYSRLVPAADRGGSEAATQAQRGAVVLAVQVLRGGLSPASAGAEGASSQRPPLRADEASAVLTSESWRSLVPAAGGRRAGRWPFKPHRMFVRADFEGVRVALRVVEADG